MNRIEFIESLKNKDWDQLSALEKIRVGNTIDEINEIMLEFSGQVFIIDKNMLYESLKQALNLLKNVILLKKLENGSSIISNIVERWANSEITEKWFLEDVFNDYEKKKDIESRTEPVSRIKKEKETAVNLSEETGVEENNTTVESCMKEIENEIRSDENSSSEEIESKENNTAVERSPRETEEECKKEESILAVIEKDIEDKIRRSLEHDVDQIRHISGEELDEIVSKHLTEIVKARRRSVSFEKIAFILSFYYRGVVNREKLSRAVKKLTPELT